MGSSKKKTNRGPVAPPIVTLAATHRSLPGAAPINGLRRWKTNPPAEGFRIFLERPIVDPDGQPYGRWEDLAEAYANAVEADAVPKGLAKLIQDLDGGRFNVSQRANDAAGNLIAASYAIDSALLLHLRSEMWCQLFALTIIRSALECTGTAALLAIGTADEPHRWEHGPSFTSSELMAALQQIVDRERASGESAAAVYRWLCQFTHVRHDAIRDYLYGATPERDTAFRVAVAAAIGFVSWAMACVTVVVSGIPSNPPWPQNFPADVPWR